MYSKISFLTSTLTGGTLTRALRSCDKMSKSFQKTFWGKKIEKKIVHGLFFWNKLKKLKKKR